MVHLFKEYYLDADANNFRLVKRREVDISKRKEENKNKETYVIIGFYQSIGGLYNRLVRECEKDIIMDENVKTVADFIARMSGLVGNLEGTLKVLETIPPIKRNGEE